MAPFYFEREGSYVELKGPAEIRFDKDRFVSLTPQENKEKIGVCINGRVSGTVENGSILPTGNPIIVSGQTIVFESGMIPKVVIYSEKPIGETPTKLAERILGRRLGGPVSV